MTAQGGLGSMQELLPDPVLENIGRHLPLGGMRTCRLVCKRWAAVIGESVAAVGVSADLLRSTVLGDAANNDGDHSSDSDDDGEAGDNVHSAEDQAVAAQEVQPHGQPSSITFAAVDPSSSSSSGAYRPPGSAMAVKRLRRLSRRLSRAFPRAHTCVIHIDVGYGDHAAPDPHESAIRLATLLGGLPNLARIRLAMKALGADDTELVEPEEAEDMDYCFNYTLRLLQHLLLRPPPREARALAPTAAALRRRKAMLPHVPWPPAHCGRAVDNISPAEQRSITAQTWQQQADCQNTDEAIPPAASVSRHPRQLLMPPCWALELHLGALPRSPAAWGDLASLRQLATLLLPSQRPRLPASALPHLALLTGLRALQLSIAGAAAAGGVGLLAGPGMAVLGGPEEELWGRISALSALTGLTHLGLHANALPTRPLSRALAALTNLRDLFVAGCVVVDVETLARPDGLTALERLAVPQQLLLWEVELLVRHCRRLRHLEVCGTWEGCCWEGGKGGAVTAIQPPPVQQGAAAEGLMFAAGPWGPAPQQEQQQQPDGDEQAVGEDDSHHSSSNAGAGQSSTHVNELAPAWLLWELVGGGTWQRLVQDGWQALQCTRDLDASVLPRNIARGLGVTSGHAVVGARRGHGGRSAEDAGSWLSLIQLCALLGLHRALYSPHAPDALGDDSAALAGIRLDSCMHMGCSVSGISLLACVLQSARRVPGYDPADVIIMEGEVPAGAIDQLLDEVYSNDMPEPEWDGLDGQVEGEVDDDEEEEGQEHGEPTQQQLTAEDPQHVEGRYTPAGQRDSLRPCTSTTARRLRPHHQGITSVFTWAGSGSCLGPLGRLLPDLHTLNVSLPPSVAGLVMQEAAPVEELPEAVISFGDTADDATSTTTMTTVITADSAVPEQGSSDEDKAGSSVGTAEQQQQQQQQQQPGSFGAVWTHDGSRLAGVEHPGDGCKGDDVDWAPAKSEVAPASPHANITLSSSISTPVRSSTRAFMSLRHLTIGNGTSPSSQWDPSARLGDAVMRAIGKSLPSLETLQLDGVLCFSGDGLSSLGSLTRLKTLALHHWLNTLTAMQDQLLRVPVLSLPSGLTSLRAMHVQFQPDWDRHSQGQHHHREHQQRNPDHHLQQQQHHQRGAECGPGSPDPAPWPHACLSSIFSEMQELDWTHCDHAAADRLLEMALPHCKKMQLLHVSGPGAYYHTPLPSAFEYGVTYGLEAGSLFMLPWSTWLPALFGHVTGGVTGGTWLRHLADLEALTELHLDLPLTLPSQVRELVDALVKRGSLHSLALHGVAISLITRRDWVVRQFSRLAAIHLQNINVSFGRHVLATLPSWMRRGGAAAADALGGGPHRHGSTPPAPDARDMRMLQQLAAAFTSTPEAHFVMHTGDLEESIHSVPWGLPLPDNGGANAGGGGGGGAFVPGGHAGPGVGPGPVGEGVEQEEQPGQGQQQVAGQQGQDQGGDPAEFQFPLPLRVVAHLLAMAMGPRAAVKLLARALAPVMGAHDFAGQWQVNQLLMAMVAPHHDPERVDLPQGVVGWSWASWAFMSGLACAMSTVCLPVWTAVAKAVWRHMTADVP